MNFSAAVAPRAWQSEAVAAWVTNGRRGIAEVVTGAGKTLFAELCMQEAVRAGVAKTVIILVPTVALLDQWYVSLADDLGLPDESIALWSSHRERTDWRMVNVMVLNTARQVIPTLGNFSESLLIVDECHRIGSQANSRVLLHSYAATLGLSATPENDYDSRLSDILKPTLGEIIYSYGLADAHRDGIVSTFELINVEFNLLPTEQKQYDAWTRRIARALRRKDTDSEETVKMLLQRRARCAARARMRVPVAARIVDEYRGARLMIFHESIEDAKGLLTLLLDRGHSATIYHSGVSDSMRRDNLRLYRKGMFDVLVTCRALDEGVNIPEVQIAIIASATASTRQRIQRLGRVLRPAPGKQKALVYSLYATKAEAQRLTREAAALSPDVVVKWRAARASRG